MAASLGALAVHLALLIFAGHSFSTKIDYKLQLGQTKKTNITKKNRNTKMKDQDKDLY